MCTMRSVRRTWFERKREKRTESNAWPRRMQSQCERSWNGIDTNVCATTFKEEWSGRRDCRSAVNMLSVCVLVQNAKHSLLDLYVQWRSIDSLWFETYDWNVITARIWKEKTKDTVWILTFLVELNYSRFAAFDRSTAHSISAQRRDAQERSTHRSTLKHILRRCRCLSRRWLNECFQQILFIWWSASSMLLLVHFIFLRENSLCAPEWSSWNHHHFCKIYRTVWRMICVTWRKRSEKQTRKWKNENKCIIMFGVQSAYEQLDGCSCGIHTHTAYACNMNWFSKWMKILVTLRCQTKNCINERPCRLQQKYFIHETKRKCNVVSSVNGILRNTFIDNTPLFAKTFMIY